LLAVSLGSRDALKAVAPEIRDPAAELYDAFLPGAALR